MTNERRTPSYTLTAVEQEIWSRLIEMVKAEDDTLILSFSFPESSTPGVMYAYTSDIPRRRNGERPRSIATGTTVLDMFEQFEKKWLAGS